MILIQNLKIRRKDQYFSWNLDVNYMAPNFSNDLSVFLLLDANASKQCWFCLGRELVL